MSDVFGKSQRVIAIREKARSLAHKILRDPTYEFVLTEDDMNLLLLIRAMEYGKMEITVHGGLPSTAQTITPKIDFGKEVIFANSPAQPKS